MRRRLSGRPHSDRWLDLISIRSVVSLSLLASASIATGQDVTGRGDGVSTCKSLSSASRTRAACGEEEQSVLGLEREVTISHRIEAPESMQCATEITLEYLQRDTFARVEGLIENATCSASSGQFEIEAQVRYESGEIERIVFSESWQRDDDRPVVFTRDYPIGQNVELIRLRSRGLHCVCVDAVE